MHEFNTKIIQKAFREAKNIVKKEIQAQAKHNKNLATFFIKYMFLYSKWISFLKQNQNKQLNKTKHNAQYHNSPSK